MPFAPAKAAKERYFLRAKGDYQTLTLFTPRRFIIAKNQNTFLKRQREMEKKAKAQLKRQRRQDRKEANEGHPAVVEQAADDDMPTDLA
ncbi:MAG: hypothetical protein NXI32_28775 [bacterium]|nr:hypothetical protein [bacterium]